MNALEKRIEAIEKAIKSHDAGLFTVFYKDGSTRRLPPMDAVKLALTDAENIERFEEDEGSTNEGVLEGLANALLIPADEELTKEMAAGV